MSGRRKRVSGFIYGLQIPSTHKHWYTQVPMKPSSLAYVYSRTFGLEMPIHIGIRWHSRDKTNQLGIERNCYCCHIAFTFVSAIVSICSNVRGGKLGDIHQQEYPRNSVKMSAILAFIVSLNLFNWPPLQTIFIMCTGNRQTLISDQNNSYQFMSGRRKKFQDFWFTNSLNKNICWCTQVPMKPSSLCVQQDGWSRYANSCWNTQSGQNNQSDVERNCCCYACHIALLTFVSAVVSIC